MLTEGKEAVRTPVTRMSEALTAVAPSDAADVEYFSVTNPLGWSRDQVRSHDISTSLTISLGSSRCHDES